MTERPLPSRRRTVLRAGLWATILVATGLLIFIWTFGLRSFDSAVAVAEEPYGTPFALVDQTGAPFSREDLLGQPTAIFFGFTHCPDICPTTLYELAAHKQALEAEGEALRVVFVTVDPERDTAETLADYVGSLGTEVTALTGPAADVEAMLDGWGIHHERVGDGPNYTMDHTASTLLLGSGGQFVGTIAYGEAEDAAREKLMRLATL